MTTEVLDTATTVTEDDIHATRLMDDTHVTRTGLANMVKIFTPGGSSVELPEDEGKTVAAYLADAQITVSEYDVVYLNGAAVRLDTIVPVGHDATNVITTSSEICCG